MVSTKKQKKIKSSSLDHQKWEVIFNTLKQMLKKQVSQLDSLIEDRQILQERIRIQHQRWKSENQRQLSMCELEKFVEISKADLLLSYQKRDALVNTRKLEHTLSELDDFKAWYNILSHRCPDEEGMSPDKVYESLKARGGEHINSTSREESKHHSTLEKEVAMLKREYKKLSVKHTSDLYALQNEKDFVWNQYKMLEGQLNNKNDEINQANERITNLVKNMEQLQSANIEKDETLTTLRANTTELEAAVKKKDRDISRLSKEIELLRSKVTDGVPLVNNSSTELSSSGVKTRKTSRRKASVPMVEETTSEQLRATISSLRARLSELEAKGNQKSAQISKLLKESKLLISKTSVDTPVLKHCMNEQSSSRSRGRGNGRKGRTATVDEETSFMQPEATIASLKAKISEMEDQGNKKDEEISALSKELTLLRSKSAADTPVLKPCTNRQSSSRSRGRTNGKYREESAALKEVAAEQGGTQSKRKRDDVVSIKETPKLFTSKFKIPKLRIQSPRGR
ncbi:uncharacterized protein [Spinacia oleracea]|uniref:Uncharacterized protein isoform X2 n=1 Tax=Spinacia oleracea TaxID=3562 RepID=A0ABM3QT80_SPIOL|nr:uncharacterized protein LOC110799519 isoform X2 [Spinacia oleracea]